MLDWASRQMAEPTDRNVYILGAGFSAPAGAPLIYSFLERSREFLNNPPAALNNDGLAHFKRVFEFKEKIAKAREKMSVDLDDIEELFGLVEMSCRLGSASVEARNSMIYVIAKTLELCTTPRKPRGRIGFEMEQARAKSSSFYGEPYAEIQTPGMGNERITVDVYDFFALLIGGALDDSAANSNRKDVVITFNYDLILDDALLRVRKFPDYCHSGEESKQPGGLLFLKLHGSTNWAVCLHCAKPVTFVEKLTRSFSELDAVRCPHCGRGECQALLIPPSWDKTGHREVMQPVWAAAVKELRRATRICIIGYSMPRSDAFFRYLLTVALAENHQLERLIVVDYSAPRQLTFGDEEPAVEPNPVGQKWEKLLDSKFRTRRFHFRDLGFAHWLTQHARADLRRGEQVLAINMYGG